MSNGHVSSSDVYPVPSWTHRSPAVSGSVGGVDLHIIERKICGVEGELALPLMEVNNDLEGFVLKDPAGPLLQSSPNSYPSLHDGDLIKEDVHSIRINLCTRIPQGTKDPSPVGIPSKKGGFDQRGMGDRIGSFLCIFRVVG